MSFTCTRSNVHLFKHVDKPYSGCCISYTESCTVDCYCLTCLCVVYYNTQCKLVKCVLFTSPVQTVLLVAGTYVVIATTYIQPQCWDMFTIGSNFTSSVVLRWSSKADLVLVYEVHCFYLYTCTSSLLLCGQCCISVPSVLSASGQVHAYS